MATLLLPNCKTEIIFKLWKSIFNWSILINSYYLHWMLPLSILRHTSRCYIKDLLIHPTSRIRGSCTSPTKHLLLSSILCFIDLPNIRTPLKGITLGFFITAEVTCSIRIIWQSFVTLMIWGIKWITVWIKDKVRSIWYKFAQCFDLLNRT